MKIPTPDGYVDSDHESDFDKIYLQGDFDDYEEYL